MGVCSLPVPQALCKWKTPKLLTIHDSRLGALYWGLRLAVVVYILLNVFLSGGYRWSEKPDGFPTFWFESGDLYTAQNFNWRGYCNNANYNYKFKDDEANYWNDLNIECRPMHYGEILTKTATNGFVVTYMKEENTTSRLCVPSKDACPAGERITRHSKIHTSNGNNAICTCAKLNDYFVHGAEEIELHIEHGFLATQKIDVAGSSTYKDIPGDDELKKKRKLIRTCLKKQGMKEGECFKEYAPGETIALRMADWLMLAGVSLDERLTDTVTKDVAMDVFPYRRTVGTTLLIHLKYLGDVKDDIFTCEVEVHNKDGWTSIGSDVLYTNYESHQTMDFYDRYRRGVNVQFIAMGQVTEFDYVILINTIVQGFVLLQAIEHIVQVVAMHCLPESPVYLRAASEPFKHSKAMAAFGIQSALACQAFQAWDTGGHKEGEKPMINEQELMAVFKGHFDDELAGQFVRVIMKEARVAESDGDDLTCRDLVRIMSSGLVSVEELAKLDEAEALLSFKKLNLASKKVSPQAKTQEDVEAPPEEEKASEEKNESKVSAQVRDEAPPEPNATKVSATHD